jgi:hypothetical protein
MTRDPLRTGNAAPDQQPDIPCGPQKRDDPECEVGAGGRSILHSCCGIRRFPGEEQARGSIQHRGKQQWILEAAGFALFAKDGQPPGSDQAESQNAGNDVDFQRRYERRHIGPTARHDQHRNGKYVARHPVWTETLTQEQRRHAGEKTDDPSDNMRKQ